MMSRKKAFTQAVSFTADELNTLWRASTSSPRVPHPNQLQELLLSRRQVLNAMGLGSDKELLRLMRGAGGTLQGRFNSFMEGLFRAFEAKKKTFEATSQALIPSPAKPKKMSTALAVPSGGPRDLVNPEPAMIELRRKMGYDMFENIAALSRACGVHRITLARARNGRLVRRSTLEKIQALARLSTRTLLRRMRPPALQ